MAARRSATAASARLVATQPVEMGFDEMTPELRGACAELLSALEHDFQRHMGAFRARNPQAHLGDKTTMRLCKPECTVSVPILGASVFDMAELAEDARRMRVRVLHSDGELRLYKEVPVTRRSATDGVHAVLTALWYALLAGLVVLLIGALWDPRLAMQLLCRATRNYVRWPYALCYANHAH